MSEETKWGGAGFLVGGVIGGLLGYHFAKDDDEEDRPPIIVKGGSLIFQSGNLRHANPKKRRGKPWKYEFGWKPKHRKGREISRFDVYFETENDCSVKFTYEARIAYRHDDGVAYFTLTTEVDDDNGRVAPVILTIEPLVPEIDPSKPLQTLTFRTDGEVDYIEFDGVKCEKPGVVHFDPTP